MWEERARRGYCDKAVERGGGEGSSGVPSNTLERAYGAFVRYWCTARWFSPELREGARAVRGGFLTRGGRPLDECRGGFPGERGKRVAVRDAVPQNSPPRVEPLLGPHACRQLP